MSPERALSESGYEAVGRQRLFAAIDSSINHEDYELFEQVVEQQVLLRPPELAEYMNIKRKETEDPATSGRWEGGLKLFLLGQIGRDLSESEADALLVIIDELEPSW